MRCASLSMIRRRTSNTKGTSTRRGQGRKVKLTTVEMNVSEYLNDPRAATRKAEQVGYVVVKDEDGRIRMVISSNRATELLLNDES